MTALYDTSLGEDVVRWGVDDITEFLEQHGAVVRLTDDGPGDPPAGLWLCRDPRHPTTADRDLPACAMLCVVLTGARAWAVLFEKATPGEAISGETHDDLLGAVRSYRRAWEWIDRRRGKSG